MSEDKYNAEKIKHPTLLENVISAYLLPLPWFYKPKDLKEDKK